MEKKKIKTLKDCLNNNTANEVAEEDGCEQREPTFHVESGL